MKKTIEKKNSTKQTILTNAIQLFYQLGYKKTTIRKIADLTGISHVSIFWHYKSKEDIASHLIQRYFKGLISLTKEYSKIHPNESKSLFYWTAHYYFVTSDENFGLFFVEYARNSNESFITHVTDFYDEFVEIFNYNNTKDELYLEMQIISQIDLILIESCRNKKIKVTQAIQYMTKNLIHLSSGKDAYSTKEIDLFMKNFCPSNLTRYSILEDFLLASSENDN